MTIKFGTSGWRGVIADDFTFANVSAVTSAICQYLQTTTAAKDASVIVGYDTRFLGQQFAALAAQVIADYGFQPVLCESFVPTPTVAHAIRSRKALGGITFTASHNPPEYNGMKFSTSDGAPAPPKVTQEIERFLNLQKETVKTEKTAAITGETNNGQLESLDPRPAYLADLETKIRFDVIARAAGRYAYDPLWGTGRGYVDEILRRNNLAVETLHDWRDTMFGGSGPDPTGANRLDELRQTVVKNKYTLGLATDGDADRFGIVDSDGTLMTANQIIAILFDYLAESRGWTGGVARSVATSHLVDRIAAARALPVYETPVGFKYIGEYILEDKLILGDEESAGLSIKGHLPEKDGILACLLAAEAVAARGANLTEQLEALFARVGRLETGRIGVSLTVQAQAELTEKLKREPQEIGGRRVIEINRLDGIKFLFANDSWLLLRASGTEPLVRIYAEAETKQDVEKLLEQGRTYLIAK